MTLTSEIYEELYHGHLRKVSSLTNKRGRVLPSSYLEYKLMPGSVAIRWQIESTECSGDEPIPATAYFQMTC